MKFEEIVYKRPDGEQIKSDYSAETERLKNAKTFQEADEAYLKLDKIETAVGTDLTYVYIRHSVDTLDKFYDEENKYWDNFMPILGEFSQNKDKALYNSPFKKDFEEKYGSLLFKNIELGLKAFSPAIVPEMQEENALVSEYDELIASAQIEFEGEKYTISQLAPFKTDANDERRHAAWNAEAGFFAENGAKLDEIYDKMVKVRDKQAKKMGYDNYVTLAYYRMGRNCYDKNDVAKFRENIVKYIVPIADKINRKQAERTGLPYPLVHSDEVLTFRSGNPKPQGTPDDILAEGKVMYHDLSPQTAEFIDFMYENGYLDVLSKKGKAGGGYCTTLYDYHAPFIFANFNGTAHDVLVITHEAGHAFAAYTCKDMVPSALMSPSMESCEIHSMTMEFFSYPYAEGFFGKDTKKFYYSHLSETLTFLPYGAMVDHFQHIMYEKPELTPAERHEEWKKLSAIYMPWINLDGSVFYGQGKQWQRQAHIYANPFYYIDYCFAQTVALEFWVKMQADTKDAWERYMKLVRKGGTETYRELIKTAGLESPFDSDILKTVAELAAVKLEKDSEELK